jgi:uncharacterized glyoxalase superfamily protein PhnB
MSDDQDVRPVTGAGGGPARLGGISYLQFPAGNPRRSANFYRAVFGWNLRGDADRPSFDDGTGHVIGAWVTDLPPAGEAGVVPYVYVDSVDDTLEKVTANGGDVVKAPYPEGDLWVATFRDPAGNVIGVWQHGPRRHSTPQPETKTLTPAISPTLNYRDAHAAIQWLAEVFGFRTTALFEEPDGSIAYAQVAWRNGAVNLSTREERGRMPETGPASIVLTAEDVESVDRYFEQARAAGAEVLLPVEDTFYGNRGFTVRDPEGNLWHLGIAWHDSDAAQRLPQRQI